MRALLSWYIEVMQHEQRMNLIRDKINSDFRREFDDIVASGAKSHHIDFLLDELARDGGVIYTRKLFQYGMDHLPENSKRPDKALSTFFLVLSELKDMPREAQSLALDLMIYCENDPDDGADSLRPDFIQGEYERIVPMLQ